MDRVISCSLHNNKKNEHRRPSRRRPPRRDCGSSPQANCFIGQQLSGIHSCAYSSPHLLPCGVVCCGNHCIWQVSNYETVCEHVSSCMVYTDSRTAYVDRCSFSGWNVRLGHCYRCICRNSDVWRFYLHCSLRLSARDVRICGRVLQVGIGGIGVESSTTSFLSRGFDDSSVRSSSIACFGSSKLRNRIWLTSAGLHFSSISGCDHSS